MELRRRERKISYEFFQIRLKKKKCDRDFPISFVSQISKSNSHDVTLVDVSRKMTGMYKCEVMGGKPSYHAQIKRARMEVVGELVCPSSTRPRIKNFPTEG